MHYIQNKYALAKLLAGAKTLRSIQTKIYTHSTSRRTISRTPARPDFTSFLDFIIIAVCYISFASRLSHSSHQPLLYTRAETSLSLSLYIARPSSRDVFFSFFVIYSPGWGSKSTAAVATACCTRRDSLRLASGAAAAPASSQYI